MTTLYHYVHCPFCVRVRLAFGYLKFPYKSVVLPYNDERTPLEIMGKKMLPITTFQDESLNESLDIIKKADDKNLLQSDYLTQHGKEIDHLLTRLGSPIHNLVMPYWVYTQEFNEESRAYFLEKKEKKRGPFSKLMTRAPEFREELSPLLDEVEELIGPYFFKKEKLSILDIMLASHLWGLYVYPEFQFSEKLHNYLQTIKMQCHFNYHEDYWHQ